MKKNVSLSDPLLSQAASAIEGKLRAIMASGYEPGLIHASWTSLPPSKILLLAHLASQYVLMGCTEGVAHISKHCGQMCNVRRCMKGLGSIFSLMIPDGIDNSRSCFMHVSSPEIQELFENVHQSRNWQALYMESLALLPARGIARELYIRLLLGTYKRTGARSATLHSRIHWSDIRESRVRLRKYARLSEENPVCIALKEIQERGLVHVYSIENELISAQVSERVVDKKKHMSLSPSIPSVLHALTGHPKTLFAGPFLLQHGRGLDDGDVQTLALWATVVSIAVEVETGQTGNIFHPRALLKGRWEYYSNNDILRQPHLFSLASIARFTHVPLDTIEGLIQDIPRPHHMQSDNRQSTETTAPPQKAVVKEKIKPALHAVAQKYSKTTLADREDQELMHIWLQAAAIPAKARSLFSVHKSENEELVVIGPPIYQSRLLSTDPPDSRLKFISGRVSL